MCTLFMILYQNLMNIVSNMELMFFLLENFIKTIDTQKVILFSRNTI